MDRKPLADRRFGGGRRADPARARGGPPAGSAERGDEPPVGSGGARDVSGGDNRRRSRAVWGGRALWGSDIPGRRRRRRRNRSARRLKKNGQPMQQCE